MFIDIVLSNIHAILKAAQMAGYGELLDTSMSCVLVQTTLLNDFLVQSYNLKHMKLVSLQKLPMFVHSLSELLFVSFQCLVLVQTSWTSTRASGTYTAFEKLWLQSFK